MSNSLSNKLEHMNEFLTSQDLVDLGIYTSLDTAYLARTKWNSPHYIQLSRKILYPKKSVIEFLQGRMKKGHFYNSSVVNVTKKESE